MASFLYKVADRSFPSDRNASSAPAMVPMFPELRRRIIEWKDHTWDIHVFFLQPVQVAPDPLDNESSGNQQFWGVYSSRHFDNVLSTGIGTGLDAYYLGYYDNNAVYNSGSGTELRHTLGVRIYGDKIVGPGTVDWNYEGIVQFGRFDSNLGEGSIFAWSIGTETGYTFEAPWKPRASLRANFVSGDSDADSPNLQTFNPMFPKGKYFGELTPVGPYNLINILGAIGLRFTDSLTLTLQGGPTGATVRRTPSMAWVGISCGHRMERAMPASSGHNLNASPSGVRAGSCRFW